MDRFVKPDFKNIKDFINQNDKFALKNGMEITHVEKGYAVSQMKITQDHLNGAGVVQGGAIFSLADLAFAAAANSYGRLALSVETHVSFIKATKEGYLKAIAKEVSISKSFVRFRIDVITDKDELIAALQATAFFVC